MNLIELIIYLALSSIIMAFSTATLFEIGDSQRSQSDRIDAIYEMLINSIEK